MALTKKEIQAISSTIRNDVGELINTAIVPQLDSIYQQLKLQNTRLENIDGSIGDLRANQLQLINVLSQGKIISKKHAATLQRRLIGA